MKSHLNWKTSMISVLAFFALTLLGGIVDPSICLVLATAPGYILIGYYFASLYRIYKGNFRVDRTLGILAILFFYPFSAWILELAYRKDGSSA